jgi:hypothetical protein
LCYYYIKTEEVMEEKFEELKEAILRVIRPTRNNRSHDWYNYGFNISRGVPQHAAYLGIRCENSDERTMLRHIIEELNTHHNCGIKLEYDNQSTRIGTVNLRIIKAGDANIDDFINVLDRLEPERTRSFRRD